VALNGSMRDGYLSKPVETLGEALERTLRRQGLLACAKHVNLHAAWTSMVGARFADRTRIASFKRGKLEIEVDSSALMTEIQFYRKALLQDLRETVRKPFISCISFVLKPDSREYDKST